TTPRTAIVPQSSNRGHHCSVRCFESFLLLRRHHLTPTLFPYTTLFRSQPADVRPLRIAALDVLVRDVAVLVPVLFLGDAEVDQRSEEHTSELQSRSDLVCRLLLEKKNSTQRLPRKDRPAADEVEPHKQL